MQTDKDTKDFFCSEISRQVKEKVFGTSGVADIWILLEYPKPWGNKAIAESALPEDVKNHLGGFSKVSVKIRTLLIKQDAKTKKSFNFFVVFIDESSPKMYQGILQDYNELLKLDPKQLVLGAVSIKSTVRNKPLFLVCTHGKHDKCCAKFGFSTYKYMRGVSKENVWQSSHVGGDRFASNVVCFPHGVFYGHVSNNDADEIVESYNKYNINLKNFRGRSCYSKFNQIGEYFVRKETSIINLSDLVLQKTEQIEENLWESIFYSENEKKSFQLTFSSHKSDFRNFRSCHAQEEKPINQYSLESFTVNIS